jgi:sporulation protein YlmC with PRC-barrel domain
MEDKIDIVYRVLDVQLVDVDGRRCGRVDDVEFLGAVGEPLRISALLTGHGVYPARLPTRLTALGRRLFGPGILGRTILRIPWTAVEDVESTVRLREPAAELGLATVDLALQRWVERIPGG